MKNFKRFFSVLCVLSLLIIPSVNTYASYNNVNLFFDQEDNNSLKKASPLTFGTGNIALGVVSPTDTEDWYKITATDTTFGATLTVPQGSDIDMIMYNADGTVYYSGGGTYGYGVDEHIPNLTTVVGERYYIRVMYMHGDLKDPYWLETY